MDAEYNPEKRITPQDVIEGIYLEGHLSLGGFMKVSSLLRELDEGLLDLMDESTSDGFGVTVDPLTAIRAETWLEQKQHEFEETPQNAVSQLNEVDNAVAGAIFKSSRDLISLWRLENDMAFDRECEDLFGD